MTSGVGDLHERDNPLRLLSSALLRSCLVASATLSLSSFPGALPSTASVCSVSGSSSCGSSSDIRSPPIMSTERDSPSLPEKHVLRREGLRIADASFLGELGTSRKNELSSAFFDSGSSAISSSSFDMSTDMTSRSQASSISSMLSRPMSSLPRHSSEMWSSQHCCTSAIESESGLPAQNWSSSGEESSSILITETGTEICGIGTVTDLSRFSSNRKCLV
mmetsp:Transcript_134672/g.200392  ORF Transcript_134672/g.200392 Transcript_134672/m.200392 type:complete len:220 (-) Transcript_134672:844-1503(-)